MFIGYFLFKKEFYLVVWVFCLCLCTTCTPGVHEVRRKHENPRNWSYKQLWTTRVLGIEHRSSWACALNPWAFSPVPTGFFSCRSHALICWIPVHFQVYAFTEKLCLQKLLKLLHNWVWLLATLRPQWGKSFSHFSFSLCAGLLGMPSCSAVEVPLMRTSDHTGWDMLQLLLCEDST